MCPTKHSTYDHHTDSPNSTSSSSSSSSSPSDIFGTSYMAGNLVARSSAQQQQQQGQNNNNNNNTTTMATGTKPSLQRTKSTDKTKTLLPTDFVPTEYSVICGNKRAFFNSVGNRRFRIICQMHLEEFRNAPSKHEKSFVVTKVMKMLRDACPVGAFVAFEKGRWWEVSDRTSREKVGTFFRDCLGDSYKSSSKNKVAQRKQKRGQVFNSSGSSSPPSSPLPTGNTVATAAKTLTAMMSIPPILTLPEASGGAAAGATSVAPTTPTVAPILRQFADATAAAVSASPKMVNIVTPPLTTTPTASRVVCPPQHNDVVGRVNFPSNFFLLKKKTGSSTSITRTLQPCPRSQWDDMNSSNNGGCEDEDEDESLDSSNGSFYDVDDLTPIAL